MVVVGLLSVVLVGFVILVTVILVVNCTCFFGYFCSVLEKSHIGAKSDFEIWAFKVSFSLDQKKSPKESLEVATPENLKGKKYIRQSENADGSPLEPLWGSQKIKVSTKRTFRPKNLPFRFGEKPSWCRFEKKGSLKNV